MLFFTFKYDCHRWPITLTLTVLGDFYCMRNVTLSNVVQNYRSFSPYFRNFRPNSFSVPIQDFVQQRSIIQNRRNETFNASTNFPGANPI